jgi:phenylalanyl-tRNA synthetase beta chain
VQRGWYEVQSLRLISHAQLRDVLGPTVSVEKAIAVKNPLSEDHTVMRPSLVPGLVSAAELNINQGQSRLRFFEIGRVFVTNPNGTSREEDRIALLLGGPKEAASWHEKDPMPSDVYDLRGVLEAIVGGELDISPKRLDQWLLSAEIKRGSKALGWLAQVAPSRARDLGARHPLYAAELSISGLMQGGQNVVKFTELPRFPSITRDVALEVPADLPNGKIAAFFKAQKEPLLAGAEVFDVFADPEGKKMSRDKKSVAWSLTYRSPDRTLETAEVDAVHNRILKALVGTLPATIR